MKEYLKDFENRNHLFRNSKFPSSTNLVIKRFLTKKILAGICDPRIIDEITIKFIESKKRFNK